MDELVDRVRDALTADYPGAPNGRVREVPDRRAIRWYATTGLVDRPAAMRGRTALYGRRHLLQVVALKRRQAEGRTLAQIQAELAGAADGTLAAIARVPDRLLRHEQPTPPTDPARARFWADPQAALAAGVAAPVAATEPTAEPDLTAPSTAPATATAPTAPATATDPTAPATDSTAPATATDSTAPATATDRAVAPTADPTGPLAGVALGGGVVLLFPGRPDDRDFAAITAAARPLLDVLAARGLSSGHRAPAPPHR